MQILLTGASGYTGGQLMRALLRKGDRVRAFVRSAQQVPAVEETGAEAVVGEMTKEIDFVRAARGCDQIHHIAAVFRTAGHPDRYYHEVNVGAVQNAIKAARVNGCERLIHCSTVGVHGHVAEPPAAEAYRFAPGDIYQRTKLQGELEVAAACQRGLPAVIVRPSPIYGEGDLRLLKLFRAIRKRRFVMIGSGEPKLHLVHISDLVSGFLLCSRERAAIGQTFIIAGPDAPTLNTLVSTIAEEVGVPPPRLRIPFAPLYVASWLCEKVCVPLRVDPPLHRRRVSFFANHREFDDSKARRELGYRPTVGFRDGISRLARWYVDTGRLPASPHALAQG
jgi:dihydroflavonol-4-reductase